MIRDTKFAYQMFLGRKRRVKLILVKLNGGRYWIRPFQLQLIEKDLKYMDKVNK